MTIREELEQALAPHGGRYHYSGEIDDICGAILPITERLERETDEAFVQRVYPDHGWTPEDGTTYAQFCAAIRARWVREHDELRAERDALKAQVERVRRFLTDIREWDYGELWQEAIDAKIFALDAKEK